MTHLITLKNLAKCFVTDEIETHALSNINLSIQQGEYLALSGPSGCGKSTLLAILGLLDVPSAGSYQLQDIEAAQLDRNQRAAIRNQQIGFIFQSFNLISDLTVAENVQLPLTYRRDLSKPQIKQKVDAVLQQVEMSHRKNHYPSQLSGGQQQRVAVARALVNEPAFILADEPTGNLDTKNAQAVMNLLQKLHQQGSTIVMVTHDPRSASCATRQVEMLDGQIIADSHSAEIAVANNNQFQVAG